MKWEGPINASDLEDNKNNVLLVWINVLREECSSEIIKEKIIVK